MTSFTEVALLLAMAAGFGVIGLALRQPLIVSFIATGLAAGHSALDLVHADAQIGLLSELGIALLLFLVGIKLDVKLIRSLGAVAVMTGLGQVMFTALFGFAIGLALGIDAVTSLYIAVALTFSSTIIVVKLLSDKREIDSLHGQIALGFLIVQDIVVVLALVALSAIGIGKSGDEGRSLLSVLLAGAGLVLAVTIFVRHIAEPLTARLSRLPELLVLFAIALATAFAALGEIAGLGKEVGGLLAGVALASTPYREAIAARLAPLRDFLLLFFFLALGATLDLSQMGAAVVPAMIFSAFVLIGNPLIVLVIMVAMGYGRRTSFLAGLTVAQISEFSLVFMAMGLALGHVDAAAMGLVTLVGLVTIAASTYMITYSHQLFAAFEPLLGSPRAARAGRGRDRTAAAPDSSPAIILIGLGRFGTAIGLRLRARGLRVLGVDFNPDAIRRGKALGIDALFGDATDPEFLSELPLREAQWIVSTVPVNLTGLSFEDTRRTLLQVAPAAGFRGRIAAASHGPAETAMLAAAGADLILEPFQDAADRAVEILCGAPRSPRPEIPEIAAEGRLPG